MNDQMITLANWDTPPFNRWSFLNMSEVVPVITDWAFSTFDVARVEAQVFAWNPSSIRVLEKAGFTGEARLRDAVTKCGETTDLLIYARFPNRPR